MRDIEWVKNRLLKNVEVNQNGCWEWTKTRLPRGYGLFRVLNQSYAHRVSYVLYHGPLLKGMFVCHRCDNPPCVNPNHLFIGDAQINVDDMMSKGRSKKGHRYKTHCPRGHEYTLENSFINKSGGRICRICKRMLERVKK